MTEAVVSGGATSFDDSDSQAVANGVEESSAATVQIVGKEQCDVRTSAKV